MGSSSLSRDQTQAPCIGSTESQPLHHQESPPLTAIPCSYLHPQATTDYFLSPWSCLFWTFYTNGIIQYIIIQYVVFVSGFFHSALMFLRFIHIVACISIPFLLLLNIPSYEKPPEVTCKSRGKPGFPASTRERPRETFFNTSRGQIPLP